MGTPFTGLRSKAHAQRVDADIRQAAEAQREQARPKRRSDAEIAGQYERRLEAASRAWDAISVGYRMSELVGISPAQYRKPEEAA